MKLNAEQVKKALAVHSHIRHPTMVDCSACAYIWSESCREVFATDALALINSQEQRIKELTEENAPKWIPIESNEKPQHLRNYFIAYVFGDSDMRFYGEAKYHAYGGNGIVDGAHFSNEGVDDMRVTHWMPIPKLP